jgi:hypothetical protein
VTTYAFTSVTTNYVPKARVLARTLKRHNPDFKFIVFVAESIPPHLQEIELCIDEVISMADLGIDDYAAWVFSHSVVEICTAIKGHALCSLLVRPDCEQVFYIDPDIAIFDSFSDLIAQFSYGAVLLTPHQLAPDVERIAIEDNELCCLRHGAFNLGFLGVRNDRNGVRFAQWWRDRLAAYCYIDVCRGLFTDQKWIDLAPALFPFVHIVRDPGYNVATWNLSTRTLTGGFETGFKVSAALPDDPDANPIEYPLRFYHFSGFDSGAQLVQLRRYAVTMPAAFLLRNWYIAECTKLGQDAFGAVPWEFGSYRNGEEITVEQRQLFRQRKDLQDYFDDPFHTIDRGKSYYDWYFTHGINGG